MQDNLKKLHDAATPGPWDHDNAPTGKGGHVVYRDRPDYDVVALTVDAEDGALLTSLRNATPAILALVEAVRNYQLCQVEEIDECVDAMDTALAAYDAAVGNEVAK
jgi:hypothetical protein